MLRFTSIFLFLIMLAAGQVGAAFAQQTAPQDKFVKWSGIGGKDNEFMVFMPEGYLTTADAEYFMGKPPAAATRVEKHLKAARYINGVVLMMEYYQGNGKDIYKALKEREKDASFKEEEANGFQVARFSAKAGKSVRLTHIYFTNKNLYVVSGYAATEDDKILQAFFESVRLITKNGAVAPNAPAGAKSTALPRIVEQQAVRLDDAQAIDAKEADRQLIVLKAERPRFSFEARGGISNIRVKLKVLYSASGRVTNVEVLDGTSPLIKKEAIEAAQKAVFIPAEEDGKLISVYQTVEYSFSTEMR